MFKKLINWVIKKCNDNTKGLNKKNIVEILGSSFIIGIFLGFFAILGTTSHLGTTIAITILISLFCASIFSALFGLTTGFSSSFSMGIGTLIIVCGVGFFQDITIPIWVFITLCFISTEIMFWLDEGKPKRTESKFIYTIKIKLLSLIKSLFVIIMSGGLFNFVRKIIPYIRPYLSLILEWCIYLAIGLIALAIVLGILWLYIKINSLKYK